MARLIGIVEIEGVAEFVAGHAEIGGVSFTEDGDEFRQSRRTQAHGLFLIAALEFRQAKSGALRQVLPGKNAR